METYGNSTVTLKAVKDLKIPQELKTSSSASKIFSHAMIPERKDSKFVFSNSSLNLRLKGRKKVPFGQSSPKEAFKAGKEQAVGPGSYQIPGTLKINLSSTRIVSDLKVSFFYFRHKDSINTVTISTKSSESKFHRREPTTLPTCLPPTLSIGAVSGASTSTTSD